MSRWCAGHGWQWWHLLCWCLLCGDWNRLWYGKISWLRCSTKLVYSCSVNKFVYNILNNFFIFYISLYASLFTLLSAAMITYCINVITAFHSSLGTATLFLSFFFVCHLCFLECGMGESLLVSLSVSSLDEDDVMTDNISCPTHFPKDKTERKVDSLNIYCKNTLSQQGIHEELFTFTIYSIPQNQVICTT